MKPNKISEILDLAKKARKNGHVFNPLFVGEAGLGKSAVCQQWVKKEKEADPQFGFIDLRIAYMEQPDLIGFPETEKDKNNLVRTCHRIPEFWPTTGNGLLLLEEPNRGTTGVMNCLMQLLTDRKVHNYTLPDGWIIAGCINPDSAEYDVNHMDAALRNRFEEFEVEYDHISFTDYIEHKNWHEDVKTFVNSGIWIYKTAKELAENAKYISPRSWEKIDTALKADVKKDRMMHRLVTSSILGKDIGNEFHKFSFEQAPVTAQDLIANRTKALKRLKDQSDPNSYKGDMIAATIESITKHYGGLKATAEEIDEKTMAEVAKIIPADQAVNLLKQCGYKSANGKVIEFFAEFTKRHPELVTILRDAIRLNRATNKEGE
jgi:hypothetical protein